MIMCIAGSGAGWDEDVVVVCAALEDHHEKPYTIHFYRNLCNFLSQKSNILESAASLELISECMRTFWHRRE